MTPGVEAAFNFSNSDATRYVEYWDGLEAKTDEEFFKRFLFAYMSVHTTWEGNVKGYRAISDYHDWIGSSDDLKSRIHGSGAGLHNNRSKWIFDFGTQYWADPKAFRRRAREAWCHYRDRVVSMVTGLGPAKVSFALEMAFPLEAEVLCLDVHMLRLYGKKTQDLRVGEYQRMEADWVARSRAVDMPPYIVKQMHWDRLQGRPDSRYWSHVLEK